MGFKAASSGVEQEIDWKEQAKHGTAVFFRTRRIVTEQTCKGSNHPTGHPVEVEAWLLDGPNAGQYVESIWVQAAGMVSKLDTDPNGHSAGQLEQYKNSAGGISVGLTEMTPAQHALAEAKDGELDAQEKGGSGGARTQTPVKAGAGVGSGRTYDEEPPF